MTRQIADIRMVHIQPGRSLRLRDAAGCTITCHAGTVWITQERDGRDIFLHAGQAFTLDRPGLALIRAEAGMKDEWLSDTGITMIGLHGRNGRDEQR